MEKFPQVYVVDASAGSGKTYALAKRYIKLLIDPAFAPEPRHPGTILAITFTNKAALEMKERILELLKRAALDESDPGIQQRARLALEGLLKSYNYFQVQTIDSFINAILCGCAFRLDLSSNFKTEKDYKDYLVYSLDKLIDRASHEKNTMALFRAFLFQYLKIENKTGWFPKQNITDTMTSLFSRSNKHALKFAPSAVGSVDIELLKKQLIADMRGLTQALPDGVHKGFRASLTSAASGGDGFDIDRVSDYFKRDELPVRKGEAVSREAQALWARIKEGLRRFCEVESASIFNCYIDIFNSLLIDLKEVASKQDVLFLESLNKQARVLLDDPSFLPELYCRLATKFKHFLIDEFQDTSLLQWENLLPMVKEALSGSGSLFYVGDKKQAIYRFRGGEISLMGSARTVFPGASLVQEALKTNFRSAKAIVDFNNLVFSESNLKRFLVGQAGGEAFVSPEDAQGIINVFSGSSQAPKEEKQGGFVFCGHLEHRSRIERDIALKEKILELIKGLKNKFSLGDMALLVRKNEEAQLLTSWLLESDIPVESDMTLDIRQNSYIKEVVSFLKFLNSPIDNMAFASFILGDIFARASGIKSASIQDFIFEVNKKGPSHQYLYREFRHSFAGEWERLIEDFFKSSGFIPLYELTVSILNRYDCLNRFPEYQGFFMRLLELIREQEDSRAGISAFLEFFEEAPQEELCVNAAKSDAVKIVTIHKSKGLEFPVVIIPFLEMNVKPDQAVAIFAEECINLLYLKKKYASFSPFLAKVYQDEYLKAFIDELNAVYVAFTRAIDELYIFSWQKCERGYNIAQALLPEKNMSYGKPGAWTRKADKKDAGVQNIPPPVYRNWIDLLKDEFSGETALFAEGKAQKGEFMHQALSYIRDCGGLDKDETARLAVEHARTRLPFFKDASGARAAIARLLGDEALNRYFDVKGADVYTEKEVVDAAGNTFRIDRLILTKDEAIVIDYKSAKGASGEYRAQVKGYMGIIKGIYPGLKVKGVLLYLDDFSAELI